MTEEDFRNFPDLIREADRKELSQFVHYKVFKKRHLPRLPPGANLVDCTWIRVWKKGKVKSRLCARGCFDKQKQLIEKHSSTATRLSQRVIMSQFLIDGLIYSTRDDPITLISLDISGAFLQGLEYEELIRISRELGYESKNKREVFIVPPENVWKHFRALVSPNHDLFVQDSKRGEFCLECLRAMYGFTDAPLMFQLCLIQFGGKSL